MPTHGPSTRPLSLAFVIGQRVASYPSLPPGGSLDPSARLAAHPRRTLGALAVVLAAIGITVGSGANFTASAANPGNVFTHRHARRSATRRARRC